VLCTLIGNDAVHRSGFFFFLFSFFSGREISTTITCIRLSDYYLYLLVAGRRLHNGETLEKLQNNSIA